MISVIEYGEIAIFVILIMASIIALGVILDRYITIRPHIGKKAACMHQDILKGLRSLNSNKYIEKMKDNDSIYTRFTSYCLSKMHESRLGLNELMESRIMEEISAMEKRLPILNTLGNNAPFIGLLGTVLGVIKAFHGLGMLGNVAAEVVMRGISSALVATAAGLFIAVPVVMFNNYFMARIQEISTNLRILSKEINAFAAHSTATVSLTKKKKEGGCHVTRWSE